MSAIKDTPPPADPPKGPHEETVLVERRSRPWIPVLLATVIAAIVLALLLIPGVLIYPEEDTTAEDRQRMIALQEESNKALEERITALRALVQEDDVCVAEDGFFRRNEDGKLEPFGPAEEALLPRAAGRQPLEKEEIPDGVAFEGNLVQLLDLATVMVLAPKIKAQGTGFFVAPGLVVTNRHVIGDNTDTPLFVLGKGLEKPTAARLIAETGGTVFFTPDYALLKIKDADDLPYLVLTDKAKKLQEVIAAGFPGLLNETDEDIQRLASGDLQSMPEPSVTTGSITAQQAPRGAPVLAHTATISSGSSGGPLVDECGRVVGMNTFVRSRKQDGGRMNYALGTPSLTNFLKQQNVDAKISQATCAPKPLVAKKAEPEEIKKGAEAPEKEKKVDPDAKPESKSE